MEMLNMYNEHLFCVNCDQRLDFNTNVIIRIEPSYLCVNSRPMRCAIVCG